MPLFNFFEFTRWVQQSSHHEDKCTATQLCIHTQIDLISTDPEEFDKDVKKSLPMMLVVWPRARMWQMWQIRATQYGAATACDKCDKCSHGRASHGSSDGPHEHSDGRHRDDRMQHWFCDWRYRRHAPNRSKHYIAPFVEHFSPSIQINLWFWYLLRLENRRWLNSGVVAWRARRLD